MDQSLECGDFLAHGRKKASILQKLKDHKGPITSCEDIDKVLSDFPSWENFSIKSSKYKEIKCILQQELTYARDYVFDNLKRTSNPLFKVNKLSINEMVENLRVLYGKRGNI